MTDSFNKILEDARYIVEHSENYESKLSRKVSHYEVGTYFYAWLLRTNGEEVAVSLVKSNSDPDELQANKDLFLNKIKSNQPTGYYSDKSDNNYKFISYSVLADTDLIIACVADIPKSALPQAEGLDFNTIFLFPYI